MYQYKARLLKVIDGDTIDVELDLGFNILTQIRLRFDGVNTPESRTSDKREKELGLKTKEFTKLFCENAKNLVIETAKSDKYGRYLARVFDGTLCLNDILIKEGLAREYHGEHRDGWFEEAKIG